MKKIGFSKGIKTKILLSYIILAVSIVITSSIIIYINVVSQTKSDYIQSTYREIQQVDIGIDRYINSIADNVNMMATSELLSQVDSRITSYINMKGTNGVVPMEPLKGNAYEAEVYKYFENIGKTHSYIQAAFIGVEENGGYVQYPAKERSEGYDSRTRSWYKQSINSSEKVNILDAYKSSSGDVSIGVSSAIKDSKGNPKGVVAVDIGLQELTNMIKDIKIGENGYILLVDKSGSVLANPKDESTLFKNIKELNIKGLEDISKLEAKNVDVKGADGRDYVVNIQKSQNQSLGWIYISFTERTEFLKSANKIGIVNIIVAIIFIIISIISANFIAGRISKPINTVASHIRGIGTGDFSNNIEERYLLIKDEIGDIARSTESMQRQVRDMLLNVKDNFFYVQNESEKLSDASKQMALASSEVSDAIQEVSKGAISQAEELGSVSFITTQLNEALIEITELLRNLNIKSKHIGSLADTSNSDMVDLADTVQNLKNTFESFLGNIKSLDTNINKIDEITSLINSIAEQTNLLALNAAIEAARAGESGLGFAVVAGEIRKLSEKTKESADNINGLIKEIVNVTSNIIDTSKHLSLDLNNQEQVVDKGINSFKNIIGSIEDIIPIIDNMDSSIENINRKNDHIVASIGSVSSSAQEMSASSEEISASSEQMSSSAEQVSNTSETLTNMTKDIMNKIKEFKL